MTKHKNRKSAGTYSHNNASQRRVKDFKEKSLEELHDLTRKMLDETIIDLPEDLVEKEFDLTNEDVENRNEEYDDSGYAWDYCDKTKFQKSEHVDIKGQKQNTMSMNENAAYKSTVHTMPTQKDIERKYEELIASLNDALEELNDNWSNNSCLNELNREVLEQLRNEITNAKIEMNASLHAVSWDNLVIAFFGETNAGKSTIIETFRILFDSKRPKNRDGMIVGDGQSDFTKDYNEYPLEIEGKRFTLIDVPGIEGKEKEYSDKIQTALRKAHCVFYVQGHNKKPDEETAKKIKEYLGDWVNVFSIQNIRGGVSNYDEEEERQELLTEYVRKNENLIKETFTKILGKEVYKGNIPLQALLAMCAKATFAPQREDLIKNQRKLFGYFGNAEGILRFSQFQTIINLVKAKSENFLDEIIEANKQKQISLARSIGKKLESIIEKQQEEIKDLKEAARAYKNSTQQAFLGMRTFLNNKIPSIIDQEFNKLKSNICDVINSFDDADDIKSSVRAFVNKFSSELSGRLEKESQDATHNLNEKLTKASKRLEGIYKASSLNIPRIDTSLSFDINNDLEDLDVSFGDVLITISSIGGTAGTGAMIGTLIGGPIGTVIGGGAGAAIGAIGRLFSSDGGKADVRNNISNTLGKEREKIKNNIKSNTAKIILKLNSEEKNTLRDIDNLMHRINAISDTIDDVVYDMERHINKLKTKEYGKV